MKGIEFFLRYTKSFRQDLRRAERRSKDLTKLERILHDLRQGLPLLPHHRNHLLRQGSLKGAYELHIDPDWLLVYRRKANTLVLMRTCSHSDLW